MQTTGAALANEAKALWPGLTPQRELKVLMIAELDPRIGGLRRGPQLRVRYAPPGVRYYVPGDLTRLYVAPPTYERLPPSQAIASMLRQAARLLKPPVGRGFDLVHTFFVDLTRSSVPCVHESDQSVSQYLTGYLMLDGLPERLLRPVVDTIVSRCPAVVTWSSWAAEGFVSDGADRGRVYVIPPPMQLGEPRPHERLNVLVVGRDLRRKGLDLALRAFRKATKGLDGAVRLFVIGPVRQLLDPADRNIVAIERASEEYLHESILPITDIVLAPSRAEAYNLTVLEAMAHGAVPIVSKVGGLPELVSDGGIVVPPEDDDSLAEAIESLVLDDGLREKLSARTLEIVAKRHDPETIGESIQKVYLRALEEGS